MPEILTSNFLVAYIDLLGQSEKLKKYPLIPAENDENFNSWQRETYGLVMGLRQTITNMLKIYNSNKLFSKQIFKTNGIKIKPFSDSIIMYTSLYEENENCLPIIDISSIINSLGITLLASLAHGINFRIGIDIGLCNDDNMDGIYGSAISLAYKLESEVANYQRIVIGKQLYEYLIENEAFIDKSGNLLLNSNISYRNQEARSILNNLLPINQGNYMVNIFADDFKKIFYKIGQKNIANEAYKQINIYIDNFDETKEDLKVLTKYLLLKRFFDLKMQNWNQENV